MNNTWRYVYTMLRSNQRRHIWEWLRSRQPDYLINTPSPWLTFDAIRFLKQWLQTHPAPYVFEYGSGGSTLFWLANGCRCVSVEHDTEWYTIIAAQIQQLQRRGQAQIDYRLVPPAPGTKPPEQLNPADPLDYTSADAKWRGYSFAQYAGVIDQFSDATFDIVLVDGRARPACIVHSVNKVKPGGMLIVDNADLGYYLEQTASSLKDFERQTFYGVGPISAITWQTNCYTKLK